MKLYALTDSYQRLLESTEDVDSDTYQDTLESIEDAIEDKCENTAKVIKTIEAEAKALKDEEKRLSDRRKALENRARNMKEYLKQNLMAAGMEKIKGPLLTVSIQNNPPTVHVSNEGIIPQEFFIQPNPVLNRKALLNHLNSGSDVEGVEIRQGQSLRIR
ncbi:viral Gp157 protein [Scopulibacillus darangshiensis]|uniref:Viral Gp157 protein n=1 Tax=Scopulibacillus darangshiensis TaxID=442528 RepID=A0A4V2SNR1_9BACL|nr:siphovirus Gp157 family protein [Scopulibacillus darangshiensis]TCP32156.1 viral Gp157 protein [Scopulibacillus darangshiensis]